MKTIICIFFMFQFFQLKAQFVVGKDLTVGADQIKQIMGKNQFTLFKEGKLITNDYNAKTDKYDIPIDQGYELRFKQEITVNLFKNEYDNVKSAGYYLNSMENLIKVQKILKFESWTYYRDENEDTKIYTYAKYRIRFISKLHSDTYKYQIIIQSIE